MKVVKKIKKERSKTFFINKLRSIFKQLLFVWLAFFIMVISSYLFVQNIVNEYLAKEAENSLSYTYSIIHSDLLAGETTLQSISQSIRNMILSNHSVNEKLEFMEDITNYLTSNAWHSFGFNGIYGFFDIFGNVFLDGSGWVPPDDYVPQERPWYIAAISANGEITATPPYIDADTHEVVITYSRRIFDNDGNPLAIICVDVRLDKIADYVINNSLAEGGFGILLSDSLEIIATRTREYIGRPLAVLPVKNIQEIINYLENNIDIYEYEVMDEETNIKYVLFSKKLGNGWHLGILTPVDKYYQNVFTMGFFIAGLGIILAYLLSYILYIIAKAKRKAEKKSFELERTLLKTMADLVECRDYNTGGHIDRTQNGIKIMLEEIQKSGIYSEETKDWDIDLITQSSQLHDVGKISIEDRILKKTEKLDDAEFNEMKKHVVFGEQIIAKIKEKTKENEFLKYAEIFAANHHEKWDGSGYPRGLKGNEIPLLGRIMAIVDVYDALVSERPYKKAFAHEEAINEIKNGKGKYFDSLLVDLFLTVSYKFKE